MAVQTEIARYVEKNLPWNFGVNLVDITLITLGLSLISRETILPLFVSELTDSPIAHWPDPRDLQPQLLPAAVVLVPTMPNACPAKSHS